jgi:Bacterial TSP3 repeat
MSKYEQPIRMSTLARRLAGAAFAASLISGALITGTALVPAIASAAIDSDGDGLTDDFELRGLTDPQNPDSDRDFLNDGEEMRTYHTGPLNQDSDNDDISDGDEVKRYHTDPLVPNAKPPAPPAAPPAAPPSQSPAPQPKDTDGDGLSDDDEKNVYRTNPNRKDTDRDGRDDGSEVKNGTNPRVPLF